MLCLSLVAILVGLRKERMPPACLMLEATFRTKRKGLVAMLTNVRRTSVPNLRTRYAKFVHWPLIHDPHELYCAEVGIEAGSTPRRRATRSLMSASTS